MNLWCNNGYYNTNTNEIAKYAGVSTGIIYQYFNDKKDIFMAGVENYANKIMYPMLNTLKTQKIDLNNLDEILSDMIDNFIKSHTISKKAHEELMAMSHLDEDVKNIFKNSELEMTNKIVSLLENNEITTNHLKEKVHIIIGVIDNLCHEIVYHKHEQLNYDIMKKEVIKLITSMLK